MECRSGLPSHVHVVGHPCGAALRSLLAMLLATCEKAACQASALQLYDRGAPLLGVVRCAALAENGAPNKIIRTARCSHAIAVVACRDRQVDTSPCRSLNACKLRSEIRRRELKRIRPLNRGREACGGQWWDFARCCINACARVNGFDRHIQCGTRHIAPHCSCATLQGNRATGNECARCGNGRPENQ